MRPFMPPAPNSNNNTTPWSTNDKNLTSSQLPPAPHNKFYQSKERSWQGQQISPGSQHAEHYHKNIPNSQGLKNGGGHPNVPVMHILERGTAEPIIDKIIDAPENKDSAIIETKINPKDMLKKLLESGMKVMVLLRGVPGSGKSTLAK